jgi:hypothetical protein
MNVFLGGLVLHPFVTIYSPSSLGPGESHRKSPEEVGLTPPLLPKLEGSRYTAFGVPDGADGVFKGVDTCVSLQKWWIS